MTGMDCARALRDRGCGADILFITSMTKYALEGYEVHAFAFLPKPVTYVELKDRLADCFARVDRNKRAILPVDTAEGVELLPIEDILYAEVHQHETSFALLYFRRKTYAPIDLRVLLGNALDNAVEACQRVAPSERRFIRVSGGPSANYLLVRVENSCGNGLALREGLPTTKVNKALHGFGLRNIKGVLERYGGSLTIATEAGCFISTMLIPIPKEKDN